MGAGLIGCGGARVATTLSNVAHAIQCGPCYPMWPAGFRMKEEGPEAFLDFSFCGQMRDPNRGKTQNTKHQREREPGAAASLNQPAQSRSAECTLRQPTQQNQLP